MSSAGTVATVVLSGVVDSRVSTDQKVERVSAILAETIGVAQKDVTIQNITSGANDDITVQFVAPGGVSGAAQQPTVPTPLVPIAESAAEADSTGTTDLEKQISDFYAAHNPSKVGNAAKLAKKYAGRANVLFAKLHKQYKIPFTEEDTAVFKEYYAKRAAAVKAHAKRQRELAGVGSAGMGKDERKTAAERYNAKNQEEGEPLETPSSGSYALYMQQQQCSGENGSETTTIDNAAAVPMAASAPAPTAVPQNSQ